MTGLEQIALRQLRLEIKKIMDRCDVKNADRMNAERTWILAESRRALEIIAAIEENNDRPEKQIINPIE